MMKVLGSVLGSTQIGKYRFAGSFMGIVWLVKFLYALFILNSFSTFVGSFGSTILIFPVGLLLLSLFFAYKIASGSKLITRIIAVVYFFGMIALTFSGFADPLNFVLDWLVVVFVVRAAFFSR